MGLYFCDSEYLEKSAVILGWSRTPAFYDTVPPASSVT